jgi:hypothetical protein
VLSAVRKEFSQIGIAERKYREYINDEIESASNSLQLSEFQRRLLEVEFFFPEEKQKGNTRLRTRQSRARMPKAEDSAGAQIDSARNVTSAKRRLLKK